MKHIFFNKICFMICAKYRIDVAPSGVLFFVKEGGFMVSKAQSKASNKYRAKAYDMIQVAVPKGTRDRWRALAEQEGKSLTAYIVARVEGAPASQDVPAPPTDA